MKACDTIFFLDYSEEDCMSGIQSRIGTERSDMPWVEKQLDAGLVEEVHKYKAEKRPVVLELLEKYKDKDIHIFKNRKEADTWLYSLNPVVADKEPKKKIIHYLTEKYKPVSILLYGSYANGMNDESSDFDCMIIVDKKEKNHDDSIIGGVQLDCFIYTTEEIKAEDADIFLTAYDAEIVHDNGVGQELKNRVLEYVKNSPKAEPEEKEFLISWILKTCKRIEKGDDEGNLRAFALMGESLEDYYLLRDMFYFGSKKAIRYLKENDQAGYELLHKAANEKSNHAMIDWLQYVAKGFDDFAGTN